MAVDQKLLDILVCPKSKASLVLDGDTLVSMDKATRLRYRIENDIPIMLINEAETLSESEWSAIMKKHNIQ